MKVPILKFRDIVIASMQTSVSDADLLTFEEELLDYVGEHKIRAVVFDVSVVDVIDSFTARMLATLTSSVQLKGAELVVVGIQPEVAFTMAQLGVNLSALPTVLNLDEAMERFLKDKQPEHEKQKHAH